MTPSLSGITVELAGRAPNACRLALPPRIAVLPPGPTSLVTSTTCPALAIALASASSSTGSVGSVNWMSIAMTRAPARCRLSMTRAS